MNKKLTTSLVAGLLLATNLYSQETLKEISVVSATKSQQSIKDVTSNVDVITKEELEEKNYNTVSDALKTLSGINISSNGGVGQLDSLFVRGVEAKRVLILVDGVRYNEPAGLSGAPLAQLHLDNVEQIEVVKGAQSGIWGADASGGVINIITSGVEKGTHGQVLLEKGSFKTEKYSATVSHKNDLGYVKLNANRFETDGYSAAEPEAGTADYGKRGEDLGYERDGYVNKTYNVQAGLNLNDNNEISATFKKIDATYEYDAGAGKDNATNKSIIDHRFKTIKYTYLNDNISVHANAQQSKFDRTQGSFNARSLVNEFAITSNVKYQENANLTLGVNKQNFEHINNKLKYQTTGLFLSNNNTFDKLILSQTLRYDDNSKFDEKVTGKIGAKYNFNKKLSTSLNYGTSYNAPTLGNLNYTPTLKPETGKSIDLNVSYDNFKVTYFENKIEDMIQYVAGSWPNTQYENIEGKSKLKGFEVSFKKEILEDTLFSTNYTRLSAKNPDGKELARRIKDLVNFSVDYYGFANLHINVNGQYVGDRYDKEDKQGAKTGNYTLWHSVVNYKINKNFSTYLKVNNIFDKYYQTVDGYASEARAAYVGLKATF